MAENPYNPYGDVTAGGGGVTGLQGTLQDTLSQNTNSTSAMFNQQQAAANEPPIVINTKTGPDGKIRAQVDIGLERLGAIANMMSTHKEAVGAMAERAAFLRQQEERTRHNPILSVLTSLAGNLAAGDERLSPVVRALGQTSLQLNPGANTLARERVALENQIATQSEADIRTQMAGIAREHQLMLGELALGEKQRAALVNEQIKTDAEARKKQEADDRNSVFGLKEANLMVSKTGRAMTADAFAGMMRSHKITDPDMIRDLYLVHQEEANAYKAQHEQEYQEKRDLARENTYARYQNSVNLADHRLENQKLFASFRDELFRDKKLSIVPEKDLRALAGLRETDRYLDSVSALLDDPKFAKKMGTFKLEAYVPLFAKDPDRVKIENLLTHEIPRVLNIALRGGQGGASILRTEAGREMIKNLGVMKTMTIPQAKAVIENIRLVVSESRQPLMAAYPKAPWDEYQWLLGRDAGFRPKAGSGMTPLTPGQAVQAGGYVDTDDLSKWMTSKGIKPKGQ